jgi:hypothetical protein
VRNAKCKIKNAKVERGRDSLLLDFAFLIFTFAFLKVMMQGVEG